jgi:hypothetical protein
MTTSSTLLELVFSQYQIDNFIVFKSYPLLHEILIH